MAKRQPPRETSPRLPVLGLNEDRLTLIRFGGVLTLLILVVFGRSLRQEFVDWDDTTAIVYNPDYNPPEIDRLGHYWTESYRNFYAPVLYTVWGVAAQIAHDEDTAPDAARGTASGWRLSAGPFHALNLLAHACGSMFALAILHRLFGRRIIPAFVGAAVFALHPLQAEPVAWASTLYTPLSVALGLAGWWRLLVAIDRREDPTTGRHWLGQYLLATALFGLSLLTKPSMVLLPMIVLLVELTLRSRTRQSLLRTGLLMTVWLLMSVAAAVVLSRLAQPALDVIRPSIPERLLVAGDAVAFYLQKVIWPVGLTPDYGRTPAFVLAQDHAWLGIAVAVCVLVLCLAVFRKNRAIAVGMAVFVAAGLPTFGLVPFDFQLYSTVADRYAYFSLFGIAIVTAGCVDRWLIAPRGRRVSTSVRRISVVGVAVMLVMSGLTLRQVGFWRDSPTLCTRALDMNPTSRVGLQGMLEWLNRQQRPAEAADYGRRLVAHHTYDSRLFHATAQVLMQVRQWDEAIAMLQKASELSREPSDKADAINAQGVAYAQSARPTDAERCFRSALDMQPGLHSAHRNLASLYLSQNRLTDALAEFEKALRIDPQNPLYNDAVRQLSQDLQQMTPQTVPSPR